MRTVNFLSFPHLVVSLLLQQTLVVARDLSSQLLFSLRQEVHPGLTLLEEALLLEHHRLQFAGEGQRNINARNINIQFKICPTLQEELIISHTVISSFINSL